MAGRASSPRQEMIAVLGGPSVGKTKHFGRDELLYKTVECLSRRQGLDLSISYDVAENIGAYIKVERRSAATISIDLYGFNMNINNNNINILWFEFPGQDYLALCILLHRLHHETEASRRSLDTLLRHGSEIVDKLGGEGYTLPAEIAESLLGLLLGADYPYKEIIDRLIGVTVDDPRELIREVFRERDFRRLVEAVSPGRGAKYVIRVLNGLLFYVMAEIYKRLIRLYRATVTRPARVEREVLAMEALLSYVASYLYLKSLIPEEERVVLEASIVKKAGGLARLAGVDVYEILERLPVETNTVCIGTACDPEREPIHSAVNPLLEDNEEALRIYREASYNLLDHRIIVTGPVIAGLQLALLRRSKALIIVDPIDIYQYIVEYIGKHLSFRVQEDNEYGEVFSLAGAVLSAVRRGDLRALRERVRLFSDRVAKLLVAGRPLTEVASQHCDIVRAGEAERQPFHVMRDVLERVLGSEALSPAVVEELRRAYEGEEGEPYELLRAFIARFMELASRVGFDIAVRDVYHLHSYVVMRLLEYENRLSGGAWSPLALVVLSFADRALRGLASTGQVVSYPLEQLHGPRRYPPEEVRPMPILRVPGASPRGVPRIDMVVVPGGCRDCESPRLEDQCNVALFTAFMGLVLDVVMSQ